MPFNITDFKSTFERFGGPARASLFEVRISKLPRGINSLVGPRDFRFFCQTVTIPGLNIEQATSVNVGQKAQIFPVGVTNETVNTVFMMDSDHQILSFFHSWMQNVVNYGTEAGMYSSVDGKLPYEIGYKDEYSTDITIHHYTTDSFENSYYETKLEKAYPISIGDVNLSWSDNDSFLTLPVAFSYERIQYSGELAGSNSSALNRGNGLLDIIGAVAGFADVVKQTVNQNSRPRSVQDAVNRLTRVRNSFDNISDRFGGG